MKKTYIYIYIDIKYTYLTTVDQNILQVLSSTDILICELDWHCKLRLRAL